jgi:hypothetical protein
MMHKTSRLLVIAGMAAAAAFAVSACKKHDATATDSSAAAMSGADAAATAPAATDSTMAPAASDAAGTMAPDSAMSSAAPSPNGSGREGDITPPSSSSPQ